MATEKRYKCLVCKREDLQKKAKHICNGTFINRHKWKTITIKKK